ncbi:DNA-binding protein [Xenophilus sp. AP218F]|nr:DNA-binding protein [Xenophilus sp. AP218F]
MSNVIQIERIEIKQDAEGRYCLNDLHKVAGGEERHAPWRFLRLDTTVELLTELQSTTSGGLEPVVTRAGRYGGTFVCKELVYAYAMWISPAFHLKVIRAFDRLNTKGVAVAEHAAADLRQNPLKYMRELLEQAEALERELAVAKPKADVFDAHCADKGETLARFVRSLGEVRKRKIDRQRS